MIEAYLYKKLVGKKVQCQNCAHYCILSPGQKGICGVRENRNGKLYSLVYGKACAINIDPIEKKPFFHFLPGSQSLSVATVGCNFKCASCQNYDISQMPQLTGKVEGEEIPPEKIVEIALKNNLPSISYTYTEPGIFSEYALDTMKLAKKAGLKNNWVTNGFCSKELFDLIYPYLDAANVDLKGFSDEFYQRYCGGKLQPVLDTLKRLKRKKTRAQNNFVLGRAHKICAPIWTEVTTLVIPTLNDKEEVFRNIAKFIKNELGPETPWHISQFCGAISWKLQNISDTPVETLQKAYKIGKEIGLKYVYTGNVPGLDSEDTYCPKCGTLSIKRTGYHIERRDKAGHCPKCGEDLSIIK